MNEKLSEKRVAELRSEFESIPAAERDPADVAIGELLADRDAHLADLKEARELIEALDRFGYLPHAGPYRSRIDAFLERTK